MLIVCFLFPPLLFTLAVLYITKYNLQAFDAINTISLGGQYRQVAGCDPPQRALDSDKLTN